MGVPTRRALPDVEMLAEQVLQLPMHPALEPAQQERVLAALDAAATVADLCSR
jgi:dTDP-4-amino-4,6-dideoxygalactose transaminase